MSNFSLLSHSESIHKKLYDWLSPSEIPAKPSPTTNPKLIASPQFRTSNSSPSLVNPYKPFATNKSKSHTSLTSFQYPKHNEPPLPQLKFTQKSSTNQEAAPALSPALAPPIHLIESVEENAVNESNTSLVNSENFETKQVSFQEESDSETEDNDYEGEDSDSSSQFSFVKDRRGGRNTSIKYYKLAKTPQQEQNEFQLNTFNENDLEYEVDEFSDYDFENNGMDDDYDDDNDGEGEIQYNNLFEDDEEQGNRVGADSSPENSDQSLELSQEIMHGNDDFIDGEDTIDILPGTSPADTTSFSLTVRGDATYISTENIAPMNLDTLKALESTPLPTGLERENSGKYLEFLNNSLSKEYRVFNNSYHLSIQGSLSQGENESLETDTYGDDILENYLDISQLPSLNNGSGSSGNISKQTPEPQSAENFDLYDVSSPIINGLTVGNNLHHRLPRDDTDSPNSNKMFIHRLASIDQEHLFNDQTPKVSPPNEDVFNLRTLKSFHGSLGDDTNHKILKKINDFESFMDSRKLEENVGLGITNDGMRDMKNVRLSVGELMGLLESLEVKEDVSKEMELETTLLNLEGTTDNEKKPETNSDIPIKRLSILGMMNLLTNLEQTQAQIQISQENGSEKAKENRRSIIDMMSTLASLESTEPTSKEIKRESINNMMNTLARLDLSNLENSLQPKPRNLQMKRLTEENSKKRYSWFNNDESLNIKKKSNLQESLIKNDSEEELRDTERYQYQQPLDQDLLDEVNQFPEDFDFEDESVKYKAPTTNFLRSNSYNKKPIKALMENKYQSNKIETMNKTVTLYRSNSTGTPPDGRSRSISRAPSTRSVTSFTSFNEEEEEEEEEEIHKPEPRSRLNREIEEPPFIFKVTSSTDSFKNVNLTTITEADSPRR